MVDLSRSQRFLFDVQACQTAGSAHRGVGRYSSALAESVALLGERIDVRLLVHGGLSMPEAYFARQRHRFASIPDMPAWDTPAGYLGGEREALDSVAYQTLANGFNADLLHVSHVFEGWSERVALPDFSLKAPGQVYSATLYDLIPLRFPEFYFQNAQFKRWYLSRLEWMRRADHLLAISDASRNDAINLLGISPDRITTIHGGISPQFQLGSHEKDHSFLDKLRKCYGITGRFVLYTGGDDYRKNIEGALRGFAQLAGETRRGLQFVVVCAMDDGRKDMYRAIGRQAGLTASEMVFTGYVPEADLVGLYQHCALFVFPSLYEGLGLPVLEAMRCGSAVIGSNTSSIAELIALPDATFDPADPVDIGRCMHRVLTDMQFGAALRKHGAERAKSFSWQRSARLAVDALTACSDKLNRAGAKVALSGWLPRRRLAMFTPLPPCRSGIADYNAQFLPFLAKHYDIDLYVDGYVVADEAIAATYRVFDAKDFPPVAHAYDVFLYEFGNSEFHEHMLSLAQRYPGVVGLHDAYLSGLMGYLDFHKGEAGRFSSEMLTAHGPIARHFFAPVQACKDANTACIVNLPCIKSVLDSAIGVISHSPFNLHIASKFHPEGWWAPYRSISQMVVRPEVLTSAKRNVIRHELGFAETDIVVTTFGHVAWTKWGDRLVAALGATARLRDNAAVHLVFAGELASDPFGHQLKKSIKRLNLGKRIRITGYLSAQDYERYLRATDIAIQLRTKSRGGSPKGVLDCLAYGVPVIVNNDASYRDYPDDAVIKLSPDPAAEEVAVALTDLALDAARRAAASCAGLAYVAEVHDPELAAAKYAAVIEEFRDCPMHKLAQNSLAPGLIEEPSPGSGAVGCSLMSATSPNRITKLEFHGL
jgi:glycosyltransferase involved in cell wall biosynthesis